MTPKQIRKAAGVSITKAAALADVAPPTYRAWELCETAVLEGNRDKCRAAVEEMAKAIEVKKAS